jgi:hypothetical protein
MHAKKALLAFPTVSTCENKSTTSMGAKKKLVKLANKPDGLSTYTASGVNFLGNVKYPGALPINIS